MAKYKVDKAIGQAAPELAKRLVAELNRKQMTQAVLSQATNGVVSEATISGWLGSGSKEIYTEPKIYGLVAVAKALEVSVDYLVGLSGNRTTNEDIKVASETTKLTDDSIKLMQEFTGFSPATIPALNCLVSDMGLYAALECINASIKHGKDWKDKWNTEPHKEMHMAILDSANAPMPKGHICISSLAASEMEAQKAENELKAIARRIVDKGINPEKHNTGRYTIEWEYKDGENNA